MANDSKADNNLIRVKEEEKEEEAEEMTKKTVAFAKMRFENPLKLHAQFD